MGAYLRKPNLNKDTDFGGEIIKEGSQYGATAMQGWRQGMEDAHMAHPNFADGINVYGVFDGHGGASVSQWVAKHMKEVLVEEMARQEVNLEAIGQIDGIMNGCIDNLAEAVRRTFIEMDVKMMTEPALQELQELEQAATENNNAAKETTDSTDEESEDSQRASMEKILLRIYKDRAGVGEWEDDDDDVQPKVEEIFEDDDNTASALAMKEDELKAAATTVAESTEAMAIDEVKPATNVSDSDEKAMADVPAVEEQPAKAEKAEKAPEEKPLVESMAEKVAKKKEELARKHEEDEVLMVDPPADPKDEEVDMDDASPPSKKPMRLIDLLMNRAECEEEDETVSVLPMGTGATAVVCVVIHGEHPKLLVANAGDSRCVLCRAGNAIQMSRDHKPDLVDEGARITKAGGKVMMGRVDGNLNLSRSLGDLHHKNNRTLPPEEQRVTANPEVFLVDLTQEDEFVVLACDGIWDVLTSQACIDFVREKTLAVQAEKNNEEKNSVVSGVLTPADLGKICEELCDHCVSDKANTDGVGCDNMTVMIVQIGSKLRNVAFMEEHHISEAKLWQGKGKEVVPFSSTALASGTSVWTNDGTPPAILSNNMWEN
eukprot:Platyproteum_vivax@DN2517_c0_g1_i1.p1